MKADIFAISRRGGRKHNDDYCGYIKSSSGLFLALADGLGGYAGGQTASRIAITAALAVAAKSKLKDNPTQTISDAMQAAQLSVIDRQKDNPEISHMRTTMTAMSITSTGKTNYAHVGDSRIYIFRDEDIFKRTLDHSVPQLMVSSGKLEEDKIRFSTNRNQLLHSLGDASDRKIEHAPDCTLRPGDAILMCSDGFWQYVYEGDILAMLKWAPTAKRWVLRMEDLLQDATVGKNNDNYSALAVILS
ncbi:MAG: serine/threonine-protein phosphatase [Clostridiales bacterium]|nr:serine/threonine-protein phosphatase [Clostridiales bacterium]